MFFVELEVKKFFGIAVVKDTKKWHTKSFADGTMEDTTIFALLFTFGSKPHVVFFNRQGANLCSAAEWSPEMEQHSNSCHEAVTTLLL